jgi:hypothetical protein
VRRLFGKGPLVKSRPRLLLLVWLLVQLLAGQQLALAHMVGHLGESLHDHAAQLHAADDGDEERGAAHSLSHLCTVCVSCLGFDAIVDSELRPCPPAMARVVGSAVAVPRAPDFRQPLAFLSRAPPPLRN